MHVAFVFTVNTYFAIIQRRLLMIDAECNFQPSYTRLCLRYLLIYYECGAKRGLDNYSSICVFDI